MLKITVQDRFMLSSQVNLYLNQDSWYNFSTSYEFTQIIIIQLTFLNLFYKAVKVT